VTDVILLSGGQDSTAAAYRTAAEHDPDLVAYLDTGTGLPAVREHCERVADDLGLQLWTLRTHEQYEDMVQEYGFPGPASHQYAYIKLKERQLGKLATLTGDELHLWTGVRRDESQRRMGQVEEVQRADRWTWHAPLHDWSKAEVVEYIEEVGAPEADLWETLGRSGDCFCGAYGSPEELLDLRAAGYDDHAAWLESLEENVYRDDEKGRWAWAALSDVEARAERVSSDVAPLCSDCWRGE